MQVLLRQTITENEKDMNGKTLFSTRYMGMTMATSAVMAIPTAALTLAAAALAMPATAQAATPMRQSTETTRTSAHWPKDMGRQLVAVKVAGGVYMSWRLKGIDPEDTRFDVYRDGTRIATVETSTNYTDDLGDASCRYKVVAKRANGTTIDETPEVTPWSDIYKSFPIDRPQPVVMGDSTVLYHPNDCSTGDVDGDGQYEIILKWNPDNYKDNAHDGHTAPVLLDCYKLDGTKLWRIDLGMNIRAGSHYTQFLVYDFDGDGKAEMICKTAPGSLDGTGRYVSEAGDSETIRDTDNSRDYRSSVGRILSGPEYLTVFDGPTGKALCTTDYYPVRGLTTTEPTKEQLDAIWGDNYGNRCDRFLATVAYLDGERPSAVMCRGYYTRAYLTAYDWDGGRLSIHWKYASTHKTPTGLYGQGAHSLSVADVDGDGCDEIIYGAATLDHDGTELYSTELGHGDALHVGDFLPDRPGLEVYMVHESAPHYGWDLHDAATGELIHHLPGSGDNGRGMAADIYPESRGAEFWSAADYNVYGSDGEVKSSDVRPSYEFRIFWDGDPYEETVDGTKLEKNTPTGNRTLVNFSQYNHSKQMNGSKQHPLLQADILGDWREELVYYNSETVGEINIFTSTTPTAYRAPTLMDDRQYRMAVTWQQTAYNQPPHISYYLPDSVCPKIYADTTLLAQTCAPGEAIRPLKLRMRGGTMTKLMATKLPSTLKLAKDDSDDTGLAYTVSGTAPSEPGNYTSTISSMGGAERVSVRFHLTVADPTAVSSPVTGGKQAEGRTYTLGGRAVNACAKSANRQVYIKDGKKTTR